MLVDLTSAILTFGQAIILGPGSSKAVIQFAGVRDEMRSSLSSPRKGPQKPTSSPHLSPRPASWWRHRGSGSLLAAGGSLGPPHLRSPRPCIMRLKTGDPAKQWSPTVRPAFLTAAGLGSLLAPLGRPGCQGEKRAVRPTVCRDPLLCCTRWAEGIHLRPPIEGRDTLQKSGSTLRALICILYRDIALAAACAAHGHDVPSVFTMALCG